MPLKQPLRADTIFLLHDFLGTEECAAFISLSETTGYEEAMITTPSGPKMLKAIRNNDRLIWDDEALAAQWWQRAKAFIPDIDGWRGCGMNERFRFYRYTPGQLFARHRDGSFQRSEAESSRMTFMVYLNAGYSGGCTRFGRDKPGDLTVEPRSGTALVFRHDLMHEGEEVSDGVKYVLRTDVMYQRV